MLIHIGINIRDFFVVIVVIRSRYNTPLVSSVVLEECLSIHLFCIGGTEFNIVLDFLSYEVVLSQELIDLFSKCREISANFFYIVISYDRKKSSIRRVSICITIMSL